MRIECPVAIHGFIETKPATNYTTDRVVAGPVVSSAAASQGVKVQRVRYQSAVPAMRLVLLWLVMVSSIASAHSGLLLPMPKQFGVIPAIAYDTTGRPVGRAWLAMEREGNGDVRIEVEAHLRDGKRTLLHAELESVDDGKFLRPIFERTRSFGANGEPIVTMQVDHRVRRAECTSEQGKVTTIDLPEKDYIANVPMNLLFLPLVKGETNRVSFQTLVCGDGEARLLDTDATVTKRIPHVRDSEGVVEIRYSFHLGPLLSLLARAFVPKVSFWFDSAAPNSWVGHRMPLYSDGPIVTIVRNDIRPSDLDHALR
jgi:hypothetical protein